jgi:hypothetical protein
MIKKVIITIGIIASFLTLMGCACPSRVAMDYGTSHNLAKFNQILDPEAEKNLEPVTGFDGGAANASMEKYRKGFEKATPAPVYSISIGGLGGTGK